MSRPSPIRVTTSGSPADADLTFLASLLLRLDNTRTSAMEDTQEPPPAGTSTEDGRGVRFDRDALYAEVWASSLTKLAPKYNLSDNGLRKVCVALGIPLPGKGHWAKIAAGHVVPRAPLPDGVDRMVVYSYGQSEANAMDLERASDDAWLAQMLVREAQLRTEDVITNEAVPKAVTVLKAACERGKRKAEKAFQRLRDTQDSGDRRTSGFDFEGWDWDAFARDGFSMATHDPMAMRVSGAGIEDATRILAAFCAAAGRRGARIAAAPADRSVQLTLEGFSLKVTTREEWTSAMLLREGGSSKTEYVTKAGAGRFTLVVEGAGRTPLKIPEDQAGGLLASIHGGEVFVAVFKRMVHARRQRRADAERDKAWAEQSAQAAREREASAAAKAAREAEVALRGALLTEASRWDQARSIRAYVAHVRASTGGSVSADLQAWLVWAASVADDMDPTPARVQGNSDCSGG